MDINRNTNSHNSKPKHISRLKQEMYQLRLKNNPFGSPPSSTGDHDTVSTTTDDLSRNLSAFSFNPDDEGTRKASEDYKLPTKRHATRSGRFGSRQQQEHQQATMLNTSAIGRAFPEWTGPINDTAPTTTRNFDTNIAYNPYAEAKNRKENVRPITELTEEHLLNYGLDPKKKTRVEMQPRVENESDCSTILSRSPGRGARRSRFNNTHMENRAVSPEVPKRSLQDIVSKIRTEKEANRNQLSQIAMPQKQSQPTHASLNTFLNSDLAADKTNVGPTEGRSFFLPAFRHLPDWTSGALKFNAMKDGVPVFVKSGKNGVRLGQSGDHEPINAIGIPEEDEQIFVSMDKLQEEVRELHDHDAMLQREAEKLQREVNQLQSELKRYKTRRPSDSAIGSDSDGSFGRHAQANGYQLETQIAQLQNRLDQASRQVGVQDIHSTALAAERDEALHQASLARERAKRLQAELESTQKDLEFTLQYRKDKDSLQNENITLRTTNEDLKQKNEALSQANQELSSKYDRLRREQLSAHKDLASAQEELASLRKKYDAMLEEKKLIVQDHASMERNNESYFKETKKLQAQIAARDQHIADLKRGISTRDQMIDNIGGLTTNTAVIELNAELEAEISQLKHKLQQQQATRTDKDGSISAKEGRIRVLKEQNLELECEKQKLLEENQRLRAEYEEMRNQWIDDRHKVVRLNQLLTKNNTEFLKSMNDNTEDCVRLEEDFKNKEASLRQKLERREAAINKVKQLTAQINEISQRELLGKPTKLTRIVEPKDATGTRYAASDLTGKSGTMNVDDDPTRELNLTQGTDFASIMDNEIAKLKQTYRDFENQQRQSENDNITQASQTGDAAQSKNQPAGILKKSSRFGFNEDTGRFSVKSAFSVASHHTDDESVKTATTSKSRRPSSMGVQGQETSRPASRVRRNSDNPTITTQTDKQSNIGQSVPALSKEARRVLDQICNHKSDNCNVCVRIAANGYQTNPSTKAPITVDDMRKGKKTVRVDRPVPVSDRAVEARGTYEEEPTIRPAMAPGDALAVLIKEIGDEIEHLQIELKRVNEVYFNLDKSTGQRERRRLIGDIKKLQAELETKSGQLYKLHDVLEGQKDAGQLMDDSELNITILSDLLRVNGATENNQEASWNGFDE
ncbi:hypothetical protein SMACR_02944 [Sordaria macrospora]|uniref:Cep57 centrosome microtubule-binding domain-containing protein n=1 Tax=Sordaria macrospora TaxID=5147 RepID=A0A8S8ZUW0_SORMA|nr:hypothetical protein SMACR_02944 [Sordaria macrospora]WPJ58305.1 hypothetical protein SMAC4_02944 [Sordaria macrospora]